MRTNIKKFNAGLHKAFKSTAAKVGTGMATLGASAMALAGGSSVASSIGSSAQGELTSAQTIIIGLLTTLVLISIGFVVYRLIKKAG